MSSVPSTSTSRHPASSGRLRRFFYGVAGVVVLCCLIWPAFTASVFGASRYGAPLQFEDPPVDTGSAKGLYDSPDGGSGLQPQRKAKPQVTPAPRKAAAPVAPERTAQLPAADTNDGHIPSAADPVQNLLDDAAGEERADSDGPPPSAREVEGNAAYRDAIAQQAGEETATEPKEQPAEDSGAKPVRLFNTVDLFRKPIAGNAPQWERVVNLEKKKNRFLAVALKKGCPPMFINAGKL